MSLSLSSLMRLDKYNLVSLSIDSRAQDDSAPSSDGIKTIAGDRSQATVSYRLFTEVTGLRYLVQYRLGIAWAGKAPSRFDKIDIGLDGFFSFPEGTDRAIVSTYVPLLCLTNLHGIARGVIAQITGTCDGGPYFVPLLDMKRVVQLATEKSKSKRRKPSQKKAVGKRSK